MHPGKLPEAYGRLHYWNKGTLGDRTHELELGETELFETLGSVLRAVVQNTAPKIRQRLNEKPRRARTPAKPEPARLMPAQITVSSDHCDPAACRA